MLLIQPPVTSLVIVFKRCEIQDITLGDFQNDLMIKTLDLFPSLTKEDLKPYLLRSRAASAYDAVTLLAKSVGVAFDLGGDSCTNTSIVQVSLENIFMVR